MSEEMEAEIVRKIFVGSYSHAENVLIRLRALEAVHGAQEAIAIIHEEVMNT